MSPSCYGLCLWNHCVCVCVCERERETNRRMKRYIVMTKKKKKKKNISVTYQWATAVSGTTTHAHATILGIPKRILGMDESPSYETVGRNNTSIETTNGVERRNTQQVRERNIHRVAHCIIYIYVCRNERDRQENYDRGNPRYLICPPLLVLSRLSMYTVLVFGSILRETSRYGCVCTPKVGL